MSPDTGEPTHGAFWSTPQRGGTLISDMSGCEPQSAVSTKRKRDCWYTVPYETRTGIKGMMLIKGELMDPPDVSLPLPASGWHAIYLGLHRGTISMGQPFDDPFALKVKLSGEKLFDQVRPSVTDVPAMNTAVDGSNSGIEELFWKATELRGPGTWSSPTPGSTFRSWRSSPSFASSR